MTEMGTDLLPALIALMQWGDRWLDGRGGPVAVVHRGCGAEVRAELRCAAGHDVGLTDFDTQMRQPEAPQSGLRHPPRSRRNVRISAVLHLPHYLSKMIC